MKKNDLTHPLSQNPKTIGSGEAHKAGPATDNAQQPNELKWMYLNELFTNSEKMTPAYKWHK